MTIGTQQGLGSDDNPMVLSAACGLLSTLLRQGGCNYPEISLNMPDQTHSLMQDADNSDG